MMILEEQKLVENDDRSPAKVNDPAPPHTSDRKEIEEFIETPPGWLLKSGITVLGIVVFCILVMAGFIKYPDKLSGRGVMTSSPPPIPVVMQTGGIINEILEENESIVNKGDTLLYVDNLSVPEHVKRLDDFLKQFVASEWADSNKALPQGMVLGDLQSYYGQFEFALRELAELQKRYPELQLLTLESELNNVRKLQVSLADEKNWEQKQVALAEKEFARNEKLYKEGIISDKEYEKASVSFIETNKRYVKFESAEIQNQIRQDELKLRWNKVRDDYSTLLKKQQDKVNELHSNLLEKIKDWNYDHYVKAEQAGRLIINSEVSEGRFIRAGQEVAYILPKKQNSHTFVKLYIPSEGMGKIKEKHKTLIKVDGYPYKEFGVLEGSIEYIVSIPQKDSEGNLVYEIKVKVPNPMITTYGHKIFYKPLTRVGGEIITEDRSILERVFALFLNLLKNR